MIPVQKDEFTINIGENEEFVQINLRGMQVGILSLPTDNQEINEEFCEKIIEAYMDAVEQITEW